MRGTYIYLRKSRKDIRAEKYGEGETLSKHKKILLDLAKHLKISIKEENIFYELASGETIENRPEIKKLINEMYKGFVYAVMAVDIDRISRGDGDDQVKIKKALKENDVKIITPTKIFDLSSKEDEEYIDLLFFFGHREYRMINSRIQRGRQIAALEGKYVGNIPPFGYNRVPLKHAIGFTLEENKKEADIVRLIFRLYTKGELESNGTYKRLGFSLISKKINSLGLKPRKNQYWSPSTIKTILSNPVYIGKIRWNHRISKTKTVNGKEIKTRPINLSDSKIEVKGLHKAIIDIETWNLSQLYSAKNPMCPLPSKYTVKNPLAGLILCKKCGHAMIRRPHNSKQESSLICNYTACSNISSKLSLVEEKLILSLNEILDKYKLEIESPKASDNYTQQISFLESNKNQIENQINNLNKQKDSIMTRIDLKDYNELYTENSAYERLYSVTNKINLCVKNLKNIENGIENEKQMQKRSHIDIPDIKNIIQLYFALPSAKDKNNLLHEIIEKVYYEKNTNGRWNREEDNFKLVIYMKLQ